MKAILLVLIVVTISIQHSFAQGATQIIGEIPGISGGFEDMAATPVSDNTAFTSAKIYWTRWDLDNYAYNSTGGRSGPKFMTIGESSSTSRFRSSTTGGQQIASITQYMVQFYYKNTGNTTNMQVYLQPDGSTTLGTGTNVTLNNTNGVWTKVTVTVTSKTVTPNEYGHFVFRFSGASGNNVNIDDVCIYQGSAPDVTAPDEPDNAETGIKTYNSIYLNWAAPASGVDGGGYMVVYGTSDPVTAPNENGIYATGNAISNGTVGYIGTNTNALITGLSSNTTYYFRIYTVDKAFNYSTAVTANGITCTLASGDYRFTNGAGDNKWGTSLNWQRYNGSSWATAVSAPDDPAANVYISGYTVLYESNANCNNLIITQQNGYGSLLFDNNTTRSLTVYGNIENSGLIRPVTTENTLGQTTIKTHSLNLKGSLINYGTVRTATDRDGASTTYKCMRIHLILNGNTNSTIINNGVFELRYDMTLNKSNATNTVTLENELALSEFTATDDPTTPSIILTKGRLITTGVLTIGDNSTMSGSSVGFVEGAIKKTGNDAFTFPIGKGGHYQPISISAPQNTTDAFTAEYFNTGQNIGTATDPTFSYISTCEYFVLNRVSGNSNVTATLNFDSYSCVANMYPDPRVIGWDGSKWKDLGMGSYTYSLSGGTISTDGPLSQYGAITLGNNPDNINFPTDTAAVPVSFRFIKNDGQIIATNDSLRPDIKFYIRNSLPHIYFSDSTLYYVFSKGDSSEQTPDTLFRIDVDYLNSNNTYPVAQKCDDSYSNYYLAHCPVGGIESVPQYQRLNYSSIYNNIDLVYSGDNGGLVFTFLIHSGGKPGSIKARYSGADSVKVIAGGKLCIYSPLGNIVYDVPNAFNIDSSFTPVTVNCEWMVQNGNEVSFNFPDGFNSGLPLVIRIGKGYLLQTPSLPFPEWSTHLGYGGMNLSEGIYDITTDDTGNVYCIGMTNSSDFPTYVGQFEDCFLFYDIFVAKFNSNAGREHITYFGGTGTDSRGKILFANNQIYIAGETNSPSLCYPQFNDGLFIQDSNGGDYDGYIASMRLSDIHLTWRTFFGGPSDEDITSISADNNGNIYIGGYVDDNGLGMVTDISCGLTYNGFPLCKVLGYYQDQYAGIRDAFIAGFNSDKGLFWSTFFGGNGCDVIIDLKYNTINDNLYFTGYTSTSSMSIDECLVPTDGGFPYCSSANGFDQQNYTGNFDGFIGSFRITDHISFEWSSYFGGDGEDFISSMETSKTTGDIYITGITNSSNFPEENNNGTYYNQGIMGCYDAFIARFASDNSLKWSTYVGGKTDEKAINVAYIGFGIQDIALDDLDMVYITGATAPDSPDYIDDFPNVPYISSYNQPLNAISLLNTKSYDAYIVAFEPISNQPFWATYYGGDINPLLSDPYYQQIAHDGDDYGTAIATYHDTKLYLGGVSVSNSFPLAYPSTGNPYWQDVSPSTYEDYIYSAFIAGFDITFFNIGINDNLIKNDNFIIFPNPAEDFITIEPVIDKASISLVKIFDITGNLIYSGNIDKSGDKSVALNISHLSSGYYVIQIFTDKHCYYGRFIKMK